MKSSTLNRGRLSVSIHRPVNFPTIWQGGKNIFRGEFAASQRTPKRTPKGLKTVQTG
jgi:hypothetical protein